MEKDQLSAYSAMPIQGHNMIFWVVQHWPSKCASPALSYSIAWFALQIAFADLQFSAHSTIKISRALMALC